MGTLKKVMLLGLGLFVIALVMIGGIYFLWRPFLRDPKDDHILEVAVASQVKTIVTHNLKDFKKVGYFGIQAIAPKDFLNEIS